jgi:3'-5' exoribonuclease
VSIQLTQISKFKKNTQIRGFYICTEKSLRNTRNGAPYLDLILSDKSGRINAKIWDDVNHFNDQFEVKEPVAVKGRVESYNSQLQLVIQQIKTADDKTYNKYGFNIDELIEKIDEPIDELYSQLVDKIKKFKSPYKKIAKELVKIYKDQICLIPASIHHHHPIKGGFLKHVLSMMNFAELLHPYYKNLDLDLILTGILFHDIGKVKGIQYSTKGEYTNAGRLVGHIALGIDVFDEIAKNIKLDDNTVLKLKHIILSHQGTHSNGTPVPPKFPEALFVHLLDSFDGKMDLMIREIELSPEKEWTDKHNHFYRELWKK